MSGAVAPAANGALARVAEAAGSLVRLSVAMTTLSACSGPNGEGAGEGRAATVEEHALTVSELADVLVLAQPFPLEAEEATELVSHWVLSATVQLAFAAGDSLLDEADVADATWLERRETILALERERRLGPGLPGGLAASAGERSAYAEEAFRTGELRYFRHVLRRIGPETSQSERELQLRTAERILAELLAGGSWAEAMAESESETRAPDGALGLFGPGEMRGALADAAALLAPGDVSSVIESEDGYHILYRPVFGEAATAYSAALGERLLAEADQASSDEYLASKELRVLPTAVGALRRIATEPGEWLGATAPLATWRDGALDAATTARYAAALAATARREIAELPGDEPLTTFLVDLALRELRLQDAAATYDVEIAPAVARALYERHRIDVTEWRAALGKGAAADLSMHLQGVAARRVEPPRLGPVLQARLLASTRWVVDADAVAAAVSRARHLIAAAADGTGATTGPGPVLPGDPVAGLADAERGRFLLGRALFERVATADEGLGPLFNADRCVSCHDEPAVGGGGIRVPVRKATAFVTGRCNRLTAHGGDNLQARATSSALTAGLRPETIPPSATAIASVIAPPLFGLGLLEAVPLEELMALADPEDADGDGVSGRMPRLPDGRPAPFGRKGDAADLRGFVDIALRTELGLTTPEHPTEESAGGSPVPTSADLAPEPEMDERGMALLADYVRFLAPLPPESIEVGAVRDSVARGRLTFAEAGCQSCHVPVLETSAAARPALRNREVHAYTDLLLHDLGGGDIGEPTEDVCGYDAAPGEYRTAALWGLRYRSRYLHDGSAAGIADAVARHGGEGAASRRAFGELDDQARADLIRFLMSL